MLDSGVEIANLLPFLWIKWVNSPKWVDELANKKWVWEDALKIIKEKSKNIQVPDIFTKDAEKWITKNVKSLQEIKVGKTGNKIIKKAESRWFDPVDDVARYDNLKPEINADGRVNTDVAQENLQNIIDPMQSTVSEIVKTETATVTPDDFLQKILKTMKDEEANIVDYPAQKKIIEDAVETARTKYWEAISMEFLDDIKKSMYGKSNYLDPNFTVKKAIGKAAKELIEENVTGEEIKMLNNKLARLYTTRDYLELLWDGTKVVKWGRLGKYFAKTGGNITGAIVWWAVWTAFWSPIAWAAVGSAVGWEVASAIQSKLMQRAVKSTGKQLWEDTEFALARSRLEQRRTLASELKAKAMKNEPLEGEIVVKSSPVPATPIENPTPIDSMIRAIQSWKLKDSASIVKDIYKKLQSWVIDETDLQKLFESIPELEDQFRKLFRQESITKDINSIIEEFQVTGEFPQEKVQSLLSDIREWMYEQSEVALFIKKLPKLKKDIQKAYRASIGMDSAPIEAPKSMPKVKSEAPVSWLQEQFRTMSEVYGDDLYKLGQKIVNEWIEDYDSLSPLAKKSLSKMKKEAALARKMWKFDTASYRAPTVKSMISEQNLRNSVSPEQKLIQDAASELGMSEVELFDKIKEMVEKGDNALSPEDAYIARAEAGYEKMMNNQAEDASLMELSDYISGKEKYRTAQDLYKKELTTKILKQLPEKETVSKEFIQNLTKTQGVSKSEADIINSLLENEGKTVNVADFKKKVQAELLPLKRSTPKSVRNDTWDYKYENISLPDDIKWNVDSYRENIYESPITTSAWDVHFQWDTNNYFGHTRVEDMADWDTRRVIEVQSDLYQKGNLEKESRTQDFYKEDIATIKKRYEESKWFPSEKMFKKQYEDVLKRESEVAKLQQYSDPTAHFRMIREEIAKAAEDGKTKLQFPTGETAMKVEGLWQSETFSIADWSRAIRPDELKVWEIVTQWWDIMNWEELFHYIITDVLWDGKFKAVPARQLEFENVQEIYDIAWKKWYIDKQNWDWNMEKVFKDKDILSEMKKSYLSEEFDISGKIDTSNPIYKFYEKDMKKYLENKYKAKQVTDENGVTWFEVDIKPEMARDVEAFRSLENKLGSQITDKQIKEITDINKKIFGDESIEIVPQILSNKDALGSYKDSMIKIIDKQASPKDTYYHEAVHKYLDAFTTEKEHLQILQEAKKRYWLDDLLETEEKLAEDFIKFANGRKGITGKLKSYFSSIFNRIKAFFGNEDKITKLYEDIVGGKAKKTVPMGKNSEAKYRDNSQKTPVKYGKVDDLASEARKYKSADDFIDAVKRWYKNEEIKWKIPKVKDVYWKQVQIGDNWYSENILPKKASEYKIWEEVPELSKTTIKSKEYWVKEVESDLFQESWANVSHTKETINKYAKDMENYGWWWDFPSIGWRIKKITRNDYNEYINLKKKWNEWELAYSRPLKESDIWKEIVQIENWHNRAYAAKKLGIKIKVTDLDLQEQANSLSKQQLLDIYNKANKK